MFYLILFVWCFIMIKKTAMISKWLMFPSNFCFVDTIDIAENLLPKSLLSKRSLTFEDAFEKYNEYNIKK